MTQSTKGDVVVESLTPRAVYEAGYAVVPIKPTERMMQAGIDASSSNRRRKVEAKYAAMIAASLIEEGRGP